MFCCQTADCGYLADAQFVLAFFERLEGASVYESHAHALQDVKMGELGIMEATFHELLVEPIFHLPQQKGCDFGFRYCLFARTIKFDFRLFHRTREVHHRKIVVTAEDVEGYAVAMEL